MCVDASRALALASTVACAADHTQRAEALARQLHAQNLYNVPASFAGAVHDVCEGRLPVDRRDIRGFPELEGLEAPDEEDCDLEPEASVPGLAWGGFVGGQSAPRQEPLSSQREDSLRGPAIHRPVEGQEVPREGVATVQGVLLPCICILDAGEAGSTAEFACQGHSACNCLLVAAEGHSVLDAVPDFEGLVSEALRF